MTSAVLPNKSPEDIRGNRVPSLYGSPRGARLNL
jgi:hypothetical protein